jgi:hypothetical protein
MSFYIQSYVMYLFFIVANLREARIGTTHDSDDMLGLRVLVHSGSIYISLLFNSDDTS